MEVKRKWERKQKQIIKENAKNVKSLSVILCKKQLRAIDLNNMRLERKKNRVLKKCKKCKIENSDIMQEIAEGGRSE